MTNPSEVPYRTVRTMLPNVMGYRACIALGEEFEDLVQEVMVLLLTHPDWSVDKACRRVVGLRYKTLKRRNGKAPTLSAEICSEQTAKSWDGFEKMTSWEDIEHLQWSLKQLPTEQFKILELKFLEGLSTAEICEDTGLSAPQVRAQVAAALDQLKTIFVNSVATTS